MNRSQTLASWCFAACLSALAAHAEDLCAGGGPPQEAFDACKDLAADASCTVTIHDHEIAGTCHTGPDGKGALACVPKHMPHNPDQAPSRH
jgi:hypothetical protein